MAGGAGWLGVAGKAGPHPSNSRPAAFVSSRRLVVTVCHTHAQAANAVLSYASAMVAEKSYRHSPAILLILVYYHHIGIDRPSLHESPLSAD